MLILPRCAANRRRRCSGEPTLSQPFRVQGFFEARWVRQCCLVSWSSWSLKTHFYWRSSFSSSGHLQPIYFSFSNAFVQLILNMVVEKSGFGIIFGGGLSSLLAAAHCHARFPTIEQVKHVPNLVGKRWVLCFGALHGPSRTWELWYAALRRINDHSNVRGSTKTVNINRIRLYQTSMLFMLPILRTWHWNWSIHIGSGQISQSRLAAINDNLHPHAHPHPS